MNQPILYAGEPNAASFTVLAALEESGLEMTVRPLDLLSGARHSLPGIPERVALDRNVEGEGPVIVSQGEAMTDSVFLAQYIDELAGGGLQPRDPYAHWEMMMWCRQVTERLSPAAAYLGTHAHSAATLRSIDEQDFADLTGRIVSDDLRQRWRDLREGKASEAQAEDSKAKVTQFVARCEDKLADGREWLMGEFSIADLVTYGWLAPMRSLRADDFAGAPRTVSWLERVAARPAVARVLARATDDPHSAWAPGPEINRWG